ncbi:MAG: hypothetical protein AAGN35_07855 [Bacteroidota bacterium]
MSVLRFVLIQLGVVAALMAAAWYPATVFLPPGSLTFIYIAISVAALSGIIAYIIVNNGLKRSIRMFTSYIIGSMLAKMMIGIAIVLLIALKFKGFATVYVLSYFFCYFIFTSFEVYALMRNLRPISKTGKRSTHEEDPGN